VRTDNVDYFCNHRIMLGLPEQVTRPMELVNGHFKRIVGAAHMVPCSHVSRFRDHVQQWVNDWMIQRNRTTKLILP
jgi:carboxypeptidase C (cathepsin A)